MADLVYVIGASGVGKDSLLRYVREHLEDDAPVIFAHRYITRPADAGGENHVALSEREFTCRLRNGCFAMHWASHATRYAVGIEINQWLAKGIDVVVNGSRAYLERAAQRYPELLPVLVTADAATLRRRLLARGREDREAVEQRLATAEVLDRSVEHPRLRRIANDGELALAGQRLLRVIRGGSSRACA